MRKYRFITSANFWTAIATVTVLLIRYLASNFLGVEITDEVADSLIDAALSGKWDIVFIILNQIVNSLFQIFKKRPKEVIDLK